MRTPTDTRPVERLVSASPTALVALALSLGACGGPSVSPGTDSVLAEVSPDTSIDSLRDDGPGGPDEESIETERSHELVLVFSGQGGCAMVSPECPHVGVYADGSVKVQAAGHRSPGQSPTAVYSGSVDVELVDAWLAAAEAVDVVNLIERLPEGESAAPTDGTDFELAAPSLGWTLPSADSEFTTAEPVLEAAATLVAEALADAPQELAYWGDIAFG